MKIIKENPTINIYKQDGDEEELDGEGSYTILENDVNVQVVHSYRNKLSIKVNGIEILRIRAGLWPGGDYDDFSLFITEQAKIDEEKPSPVVYVIDDNISKTFNSRKEFKAWRKSEDKNNV